MMSRSDTFFNFLGAFIFSILIFLVVFIIALIAGDVGTAKRLQRIEERVSTLEHKR